MRNKLSSSVEFLFSSYEEFMRAEDGFNQRINDVKIYYFGKDYIRLRNIRDKVDTELMGNVGELTNTILSKIEVNIQNIDCIIDNKDIENMTYASSILLERSPYGSGLHFILARALLLLENQERKLVIICDDILQINLFIKVLHANHRKFDILHSMRWEYLISKVRRSVSEFRDILSGFRLVYKRISFVRNLRKKNPVNVENLRKSDIFFMLWANKDTFGAEDSKIKSATYFGDMPEVLRSDGKKISYLVSPLYWVDDYKEIVRKAILSQDNVLILEETWGYFYVLAIFFKNLFHERTFRNFGVLGYDLTAIVADAFNQDRWSWSPILSRLYEAPFVFMKENSIEPSHILHIFENHAWEKCSRLAIKDHLEETKVVSCVQSPVLPTYSNFFFSKNEIKSKLRPDVLLICGERFRNLYKAIGFPENAIYNVGAMRHKDFLETGQVTELRHLNKKEVRALCATNSSVEDCSELILKVGEAFSLIEGSEVIANFHPLTDSDFVESVKNTVTKNSQIKSKVQFVRQGVQDLLDQIDILFYTDTNAAYEAIAKGVITVHVGREVALDYDTVSVGGSLTARSVKDIYDLILELIDGKCPQSLSQSDRLTMLNEAFGPIQEEELLRAISNI